MLGEVLHGLRSEPKTLPCKYFYDGAARASSIASASSRSTTPRERRSASSRATPTRSADRSARVRAGSWSSAAAAAQDRASCSPPSTAPPGYVPIDISRDHLLGGGRAHRQALLRASKVRPDLRGLQRGSLPSRAARSGARSVSSSSRDRPSATSPRSRGLALLRRLRGLLRPGLAAQLLHRHRPASRTSPASGARLQRCPGVSPGPST